MEQVHLLHDPALGLHYKHYVSLERPLGLYYNLTRPLGLHYNHYVSPSVRLWSVSENAHYGSCTLLSVKFLLAFALLPLSVLYDRTVCQRFEKCSLG